MLQLAIGAQAVMNFSVASKVGLYPGLQAAQKILSVNGLEMSANKLTPAAVLTKTCPQLATMELKVQLKIPKSLMLFLIHC